MKTIKFPFLLFVISLLSSSYCLFAQNDSIVYVHIHDTVYITASEADTRVSYYDYYHKGGVSFFDKPTFAEKLKGRKPLIFKVGATGVYGQHIVEMGWLAGGGFNFDIIFPSGKTLTKKNVLAFSLRFTNFLGVRDYISPTICFFGCSGGEHLREFYPTYGAFFIGFDILTRMSNTSYFYFSVKPYGFVIRPLPFPSQQLDFGFGFKVKNAFAIEPYCTLQILDTPFSIAGRIGLNFLIFHIRK